MPIQKMLLPSDSSHLSGIFWCKNATESKSFPPRPQIKLKQWGFFTLYTNGAVRVNTAKVAAETRNCKQES